jgi:WXXGXW repeat (2 copies)
MKKKLLALVFLAGSAAFGQISIGINLGRPPAPRVVRVRPRSPGNGFVWVDGYWYPSKNKYAWHDGYWTRPPYQGAVWQGPRYENNRFFEGSWTGNGHPDMPHDHSWDRDKRNRDYDRDHNNNRR